jgi:hypothetical protein
VWLLKHSFGTHKSPQQLMFFSSARDTDPGSKRLEYDFAADLLVRANVRRHLSSMVF